MSVITTLQALLLQHAATNLPSLQVGLLTQLYSPNAFGLRSDSPKVASAIGIHREFGYPRRMVVQDLEALNEAGYIEMSLVSGVHNKFFTPMVRLLSDSEVAQFLGLGVDAITKAYNEKEEGK